MCESEFFYFIKVYYLKHNEPRLGLTDKVNRAFFTGNLFLIWLSVLETGSWRSKDNQTRLGSYVVLIITFSFMENKLPLVIQLNLKSLF